MKKKLDLLPYCYALATIACTFFVGRLLLWLAPDNTSPWASPLFILMNLLPMLLAFAFLRVSGRRPASGSASRARFRRARRGRPGPPPWRCRPFTTASPPFWEM